VRRARTRWEEDNVPARNVAAVLVLGFLVFGLAALILALALT
jgi:hypothetical protein